MPPAQPDLSAGVKPVNVLENAKRSIATLEQDRQKLVSPNLEKFQQYQKELDRLDANAPKMTLDEWKGALYFEPPNTMQRWGYPEERPLTTQEASMLNDVREKMLKIGTITDWPIRQGGGFPDS